LRVGGCILGSPKVSILPWQAPFVCEHIVFPNLRIGLDAARGFWETPAPVFLGSRGGLKALVHVSYTLVGLIATHSGNARGDRLLRGSRLQDV